MESLHHVGGCHSTLRIVTQNYSPGTGGIERRARARDNLNFMTSMGTLMSLRWLPEGLSDVITLDKAVNK